MIEKNNATCSICGRGYYKCIACKDMMNLNPWKKHTCTSEHYKIYQVIHGYNTKVYNKEEAKSKLQMIDLSDFDNLKDNIKNIINEIKIEDKKVIESVIEMKVANLSNEADISSDNITDISDEDVNSDYMVVKQRAIRKRKTSEITEETSSETVETE